MIRRTTIEPLKAIDDVSRFGCGKEPLDRFLQRFALATQKAGGARTYVARGDENLVLGFYSLAVGAVLHEDAPERVGKGLARHPIPLMVLARLAVDVSAQGQGLGSALLKDALVRTSHAADIAGIRAVAVHAKDDDARRWYESYDFTPSPTDPFHMFILIKDIDALIR